tara:strand:- start:1312 stop:1497 length:186 start_codon:yes stop_codon:yes gene_type:complete
MQLSKNTSISGRNRSLGIFIKVTILLAVLTGLLILLGRIDFPSPSKEIEKIIPNEMLKIVK